MKGLSGVITLINFAGAVQGIFLAVVVLQKKFAKPAARRLLALLLLSFSLFIAGTILKCTRYILEMPHLAGTYPVLHFAFGPLVFLYIKALVSENFNFRLKHLLHFIPLFLRILYAMPLYVQSSGYKTEYLLKSYAPSSPSLDSILILIFAFLQTFIYLLLSARVMRGYSKRISRHDHLKRKYYSGIKNVLTGLIVLWIAWLLGYVGSAPWFSVLAPLFFSLLVYTLAYMAIFNPYVLNIRKEEKLQIHSAAGLEELRTKVQQYGLIVDYNLTDKLTNHSGKDRKYNKSGLQEEKKTEYVKKLVRLMEEEKVYLRSDLTLKNLAHDVGVSANHLSQVINEQFHHNFFDFVNAYRIEEVKRELSNPGKNHLTILAIALEAGFNSKAAFNVAFKKHTGVTPSEYKRSST